MILSIGHTFWQSIANHLWQSTLFAVAAWLITLFLKKNRARIRYWIWFVVSIKFLIPFSIIISLGGLIAPEWMKAPVEISPGWNVIHTINRPFNLPDIKEASSTIDIIHAPSPSDKIPIIIISIWLCGFFTLLLNWHKRGMRVSRIVRKAEPLIDNHRIEAFHRIKWESRILNTVRLASTKDVMEPGVFGTFKPVLLLPADILNHVNDSELEAILLHEFAHIRCKDNLIAFIHMIVQALFWFHPVVWWTGSRLVFERELACDESVLESGKNPRAYAEGILKVCENYFRSPLVCVSGVIGSNIKKRLEGIIENRIGHKLGPVKKLFLSLTGLSVLGIPLALGIINAPPSQALSSGSDLNKFNVDEYRPDILQVAGKPERKDDSSELINEEQEQGDFSVILNDSPTLHTAFSDEPVLKNEGPSIVMANVRIQTDKNPENKTGSFKLVSKTILSTDDEDSIVLAQRVAPEKVSSDTGDLLKTRDVELKTEDADKYISLGISRLKKGQIEDAVSNLNRAIDIDPGNAAAYVARGSTYHRMYQLDNAISDYNRAIDIDPSLVAAYQNRGSAYYRQGRFDDAVSNYNKALELNPENAVAYTSRGVAYSSQKKYGKAFKDFNRAIELNPEYTSAYINRGTCYHYIRKYNRAIADYTKALELDPESAFNKRMKEYCATMGQLVEARKRRSSGLIRFMGFGAAPEGQVATSHEMNAARDNWARNK